MKELNKKNPFTTPEDYFEGFTGKLMDSLSVKESFLPKEEGFVVPDTYFEALQQNIQKKIDSEKPKVIPLNTYKRYYYIVASIAAVFFVAFTLQWNTIEEPTFEDLANSDIDTYFEENELGLSTYEIAEVLPVDELEINDILEYRLDEENILDYIDNNTNDFEELNLQDDEY